jgi:simple sugar transport system ATP-binding protein
MIKDEDDMAEIFLDLKEITKSFGGVTALKGVDLTVRKGEIHCLAGENGCGKSTLIKVISGAHEATSGEIYIEGGKIEKLNPIDSIRRGIQVIYQDFAVFPNLSVAENIAMNKALMNCSKLMNWKQARKIALEAMQQIGANIDPDVKVEQLSVANKQMVAICRAIINDAKLLILDEPTTALTEKEVQNLNTIIQNLKKKGMAIIIVNHKINEIFDIADYLTILRNGEKVASGSINEFTRERFVKCMTGRDIVNTYYRPDKTGEVILEVKDFSRKGAFQDINFAINKGDVLGITGLLGSGRGEIGDALFGILPADSGYIVLNGKKMVIKSIQDAIENKIAYVPEDRLTQGLFLEKSIQENTVASSIKKYMRKGKLAYKVMYDSTVEWIKKIGCVAPSPTPKIRTLSGGNAQKIVIAKWLNTDPKLLVLNGPTVGVDIGAKADIHKLLHGLAEKGMGIIVISDDLSEIIQNCNKIIIMKAGKMSDVYETENLDEAKLLNLLKAEEGQNE